MTRSPLRPTALDGLLRRHRLDADLTIEGLSERSGVSVRTIGDIERGVSSAPHRRTVLLLADALGLDESARNALMAAARSGRRGAEEPFDGDTFRPYRLDDFIGREHELAELQEALTTTATTPIVVSGLPGVGKTSLAIEALRRLDSDAPELFLDLASASGRPLTPLDVLRGLLRQIRPQDDPPRTVAEASTVWTDATRRMPVHVILDDAAIESQVRAVLGFGPGSRLIVTSRRALAGLEGARHINVHQLPREMSVRFLERAIPAGQRVGADLDELAALCGDLPLALRVAVGRINAQAARSAEDFARRLRTEDRRLRLLVAGDLGVERAFAASCRLLAPKPRAFFQSLSLLRGSTFDARLAAAVGDGDVADALDDLDELIDLGLVEALESGRYRIHDLLRLYAEGVLRAEQTDDEIAARIARLDDWLLATAAAAGRHFTPRMSTGQTGFADDDAARRWLTTEVDYWFRAVKSAAAGGRPQQVVDAVQAVQEFCDHWISWGHWHELFALAADCARAVGDVGYEAEALGFLSFALMFEQFDWQRAYSTASRSLALADAADDDTRRAWAQQCLATSATKLRYPDAKEHARESARLFELVGDADGAIDARNTLAMLLMDDDLDAAVAEFRVILDTANDPEAELSEVARGTARDNARMYLGRCFIASGRFDEAVAVSTVLDEEHYHEFSRARAHRNRGFAYLGLGDAEKAARDLRAALELAGAHRPPDWAAEIEAALRAL